jgi:hypothetical protein
MHRPLPLGAAAEFSLAPLPAEPAEMLEIVAPPKKRR